MRRRTSRLWPAARRSAWFPGGRRPPRREPPRTVLLRRRPRRSRLVSWFRSFTMRLVVWARQTDFSLVQASPRPSGSTRRRVHFPEEPERLPGPLPFSGASPYPQGRA
jgi:hypothetical protein